MTKELRQRIQALHEKLCDLETAGLVWNQNPPESGEQHRLPNLSNFGKSVATLTLEVSGREYGAILEALERIYAMRRWRVTVNSVEEQYLPRTRYTTVKIERQQRTMSGVLVQYITVGSAQADSMIEALMDATVQAVTNTPGDR